MAIQLIDDGTMIACTGCSMEEPMGYHYADCPYVDETDIGVVPVEYRDSTEPWIREDVALPVPRRRRSEQRG
jgi:hypothetical protein